jgi:hypothetical protein
MGKPPSTSLEWLDSVAVLPPARRHRHRYHGVLAPNAPPRAEVTARARGGTAAGRTDTLPPTAREVTDAKPPLHTRYLWAMPLARICTSTKSANRD